MLTLDPSPNPPHEQPPTDELVLAAIERAARHRSRGTDAVPVWAVFEHLDVSRRSAPARQVRIRLDVLHAAGWIALSRHHGIQTWELTGAGARHLRRARRAGRVPALPESPQHRAWRDARRSAGQEIERFARELRARLDDAAELLDTEPPAHSDALFELGELLQRACWRLASASYCLHEWGEPDDRRADLESHDDLLETGVGPAELVKRRARRAGRRNIRLWSE
jgi:hypothetical protein